MFLFSASWLHVLRSGYLSHLSVAIPEVLPEYLASK